MSTAFSRNEIHLRKIYSGEGEAKLGFVCGAPAIGIAEHPDYDFTISSKPVTAWLPWLAENYRREVEMSTATGDDGVPTVKLSTGTHIYAAAFGCKVHCYDDNNPCAVPLVDSAEAADRLEMPDIWSCPTLYRIFELAEAARKELGQDVWLGPPDMQSGFDTAALIWDKSSFLCAMLDEREQGAVERLVAKCAGLFKSFLLAFRREFPRCQPCHCPGVWAPPELGPWLSNDECGAFGPALFERFCLPELVDLSTIFGSLGMHCCAAAEHQFGSFRKIPNFYGFNRVKSKQGYLPLLEHFGGPEAPVHVLCWLSEEEEAELMRAAPEGTRFIFKHTVSSIDEGKAWLERIQAVASSTILS